MISTRWRARYRCLTTFNDRHWEKLSNISERLQDVVRLAENKNNQGFRLRPLTLESALLIRVLIQRTASVPVGDLLALAHTAARGWIEYMHIVQGGGEICEL
jgi:hypothetical protein